MNLIGLFGAPGSGKSWGLFPYDGPEGKVIGLDPSHTILINVTGKTPQMIDPHKNYTITNPIKPIGEFNGTVDSLRSCEMGPGNYLSTKNAFIIDWVIAKAHKMEHIHNVVVEDFGYVPETKLMTDPNIPMKQDDVWKLFREIAFLTYKPFEDNMHLPRPDFNVIFTTHEDFNSSGKLGIKLPGAMVEKHVTLDGVFPFLFRAVSFKKGIDGPDMFVYRTKEAGTTARKQRGTFVNITDIANDMAPVINEIWSKQGLTLPDWYKDCPVKDISAT